MTPAALTPPDLDQLEALARDALADIPEPLRRFLDGVVLRLDEFPDDDTLAEMELDSPFELLGLYRGVELGRKAAAGSAQDIDMIFLYRRPILDYWCESGEPLDRVVRHVLIHEVGHHFGLSDAEMAAIENAA